MRFTKSVYRRSLKYHNMLFWALYGVATVVIQDRTLPSRPVLDKLDDVQRTLSLIRARAEREGKKL